MRPDHSTLELIEKASRDEISALRLERLRATKSLAGLAKFPFTMKEGLRR